MSPLAVTFTASAQPGVTIQKVEFDIDGDGTIDLTLTVPDWTATATYTATGTLVANAVIRVTDTQSNVYTESIPIVITDGVQLDQMLRAIWGGMNNALAAGDKATALKYFGTQAQAIYGPVFDALLTDLPQIIPTWSPLLPGSLSASIGEYAVVTTSSGTRQMFLIYFLKGSDGVWRLESM